MPWPLPQPAEIKDRIASGFESEFGAVGRAVEARAPNATLTILAGVQAEAAFDQYLYQSAVAQELFPDTAEDPTRHGDLWGKARIPASAAIGAAAFAGTDGTVVPALQQVAGTSGVIYATDAEGTIASGSVTIPVTATTTGAAGSLPVGAALSLVTPLAGVNAVTVATALVGRDQEDIEAWRSRILARIRGGPDYGQAGAYARAAKSVAGVLYAAERAAWVGAGSVGVIVAMEGPAVPTSGELASIQAALDIIRPITATVVAVAVTLQPVNLTIGLSPDTVQTRAAVENALGLFFAAEGAIGGTLPLSRIDEAISSAAGEYSHTLTAPTGPVALGSTALATLGTVTWA